MAPGTQNSLAVLSDIVRRAALTGVVSPFLGASSLALKFHLSSLNFHQ